MKAVIQRVNGATLSVNGELVSKIDKGLCVYFGVEKGDEESLLDYYAKKISQMRIFEDENGKMNLSCLDLGYEILLISQFTLCANCSRGNRPDFFSAEEPSRASSLYELLGKKLEEKGIKVSYGVFGADMKIEQVNCGPVTIIL
ncbi:MAG: D-tyrosyl-tRNA(Tyr) deacylase [Clostridia bacterium]|nr:D-tyrosyl-tRNA(Tyr) deacylase [Clostridia bacterium]